MVESDTISSLLHLYRQCQDRGEAVSLALDTRNGNNFVTFSIQSSIGSSHDVIKVKEMKLDLINSLYSPILRV